MCLLVEVELQVLAQLLENLVIVEIDVFQSAISAISAFLSESIILSAENSGPVSFSSVLTMRRAMKQIRKCPSIDALAETYSGRSDRNDLRTRNEFNPPEPAVDVYYVNRLQLPRKLQHPPVHPPSGRLSIPERKIVTEPSLSCEVCLYDVVAIEPLTAESFRKLVCEN